ncbi:uncharacterized protein ACLA_064970 [Aspergillus clavatus NRRL 1]|uniref:Uncharacterized protein n=1 Tax=Aspergillus clavatus (strain ATCC 1007 / CBS 513.65 / DSM 816 / NCTC 3887 / NRRL 1 / QM 1276 / 107) TaxID=344612 RepID=A1CFY5_ASPCL|nr:uncharacterized protein ACLA_064970 [Aspergillus clavatus NRRL 1]EAW10865.1 hypothetical protein ACLA_064970 [Aspergillus clavatus NRRL 1]
MPSPGRFSRDDSALVSIDLSRSSFEGKGLNIFTNSDVQGYQSGIFPRSTARGAVSGMKSRSISGTSYFSMASTTSTDKPGLHSSQSMRQAPGVYTNQLSQSSQASVIESDSSEEKDSTNPASSTRSTGDPFHSWGRSSSTQTPRLSLQMHDSSFTRLPGISQTNLTGRSSFGYARENGSSIDAASPVSRSSLDFVFRSRTRTSMDPISRAATIQAARQAFEEKEAAKTRKFEEQQLRAEERQMKRKERQNPRPPVKGEESQGRTSTDVLSEKPSAVEEPDYSPSISQPRSNSGSWKSQSRNSWMLFLTWLRTRIFKMRRRMRSLG